jgi:uncharacterized protein (TIGR00299 family) protein
MNETVLYIDPSSGVSGDMLLGAFLSLGVPLEKVVAAVESVIPGEVRFDPVPVKRSGLAGIWCSVDPIGGPPSRTLNEMLKLIDKSPLNDDVKEPALRTLRSLGDAEASAHGSEGGPVHLHELGGQDTIADIVGVMTAVAHIHPGRIHCGSVNLGHGFVETSHGTMPVPAPATSLLIKGMPVLVEGPEAELTTPTGAAIVSTLVDAYGTMPTMTVEAIGTGAGTRDHEGFPNLLRVFRGQMARTAGRETAVLIECGIDDVSPEYLAPAADALQAEGAKEVQLIPALTKKGRIGVLLRVLASEERLDDLIGKVLEVTGSAGLRFWRVQREVLQRETLTVVTPHGPLPFKRWRSPSGRWRFKPEYEEVRNLAHKAGIAELEMRDVAVASYLQEFGDGQEED